MSSTDKMPVTNNFFIKINIFLFSNSSVLSILSDNIDILIII